MFNQGNDSDEQRHNRSASERGRTRLEQFCHRRTNTTLGYGGLVLSAASESVGILIRALQDANRLQILSRPQIMTMDNRPASVQVGAVVARVSGVTAAHVCNTVNVPDTELA